MTGGFGSGVLELIEEARLADPAYRDVAVRIVGIPADRFVDHGSVDDLRRLLRLDAAGIAGQIRETLARMRAYAGGRGRPQSRPQGAPDALGLISLACQAVRPELGPANGTPARRAQHEMIRV